MNDKQKILLAVPLLLLCGVFITLQLTKSNKPETLPETWDTAVMNELRTLIEAKEEEVEGPDYNYVQVTYKPVPEDQFDENDPNAAEYIENVIVITGSVDSSRLRSDVMTIVDEVKSNFPDITFEVDQLRVQATPYSGLN